MKNYSEHKKHANKLRASVGFCIFISLRAIELVSIVLQKKKKTNKLRDSCNHFLSISHPKTNLQNIQKPSKFHNINFETWMK
jgi:hypothetical protein